MGTITKTIGSGGGRDFSTIALWEASLPANLVTDGNSYVGQCFNDSEFVFTLAVTIGGHTTDSTHFVTLTTGANQSFADNANAQTNALRYNQANGVGIRCSTTYQGILIVTDSFTIISKLQLDLTVHDNFALKLTGNSCIANGCIIQNTGTLEGALVQLGDNSGHSACVLQNCLLICGLGGGYTREPVLVGNAGLMVVANCTIVCPSDSAGFGTRTALLTNLGGHYAGLNKVVNTAIFGFAAFTDDTTNFGSSGNNASDLGLSVPGSGNQLSKIYANQFQNVLIATADFRIKAGANLIDTGTSDTTDIPAAIDIVGTARPQGPAWDIGAWELVVAAPGGGGEPFHPTPFGSFHNFGRLGS